MVYHRFIGSEGVKKFVGGMKNIENIWKFLNKISCKIHVL